MFDIHAHIGRITDKALVATSHYSEYESVKAYKYHSYGALKSDELAFKYLKEYLLNDDNALLGEVGLDRRFINDEQIKLFEDAIKLSKESGKKMIIHLVGKIDIAISLLKRYYPLPPFLIHNFTSSIEVAREFVSLGGYISLNYKYKECKSFSSLLNLPFLLETDLPISNEQDEKLKLTYEYVSKKLNIKIDELKGIIDERRTIFAP